MGDALAELAVIMTDLKSMNGRFLCNQNQCSLVVRRCVMVYAVLLQLPEVSRRPTPQLLSIFRSAHSLARRHTCPATAAVVLCTRFNASELFEGFRKRLASVWKLQQSSGWENEDKHAAKRDAGKAAQLLQLSHAATAAATTASSSSSSAGAAHSHSSSPVGQFESLLAANRLTEEQVHQFMRRRQMSTWKVLFDDLVVVSQKETGQQGGNAVPHVPRPHHNKKTSLAGPPMELPETPPHQSPSPHYGGNSPLHLLLTPDALAPSEESVVLPCPSGGVAEVVGIRANVFDLLTHVRMRQQSSLSVQTVIVDLQSLSLGKSGGFLHLYSPRECDGGTNSSSSPQRFQVQQQQQLTTAGGSPDVGAYPRDCWTTPTRCTNDDTAASPLEPQPQQQQHPQQHTGHGDRELDDISPVVISGSTLQPFVTDVASRSTWAHPNLVDTFGAFTEAFNQTGLPDISIGLVTQSVTRPYAALRDVLCRPCVAHTSPINADLTAHNERYRCCVEAALEVTLQVADALQYLLFDLDDVDPEVLSAWSYLSPSNIYIAGLSGQSKSAATTTTTSADFVDEDGTTEVRQRANRSGQQQSEEQTAMSSSPLTSCRREYTDAVALKTALPEEVKQQKQQQQQAQAGSTKQQQRPSSASYGGYATNQAQATTSSTFTSGEKDNTTTSSGSGSGSGSRMMEIPSQGIHVKLLPLFYVHRAPLSRWSPHFLAQSPITYSLATLLLHLLTGEAPYRYLQTQTEVAEAVSSTRNWEAQHCLFLEETMRCAPTSSLGVDSSKGATALRRSHSTGSGASAAGDASSSVHTSQIFLRNDSSTSHPGSDQQQHQQQQQEIELERIYGDKSESQMRNELESERRRQCAFEELLELELVCPAQQATPASASASTTFIAAAALGACCSDNQPQQQPQQPQQRRRSQSWFGNLLGSIGGTTTTTGATTPPAQGIAGITTSQSSGSFEGNNRGASSSKKSSLPATAPAAIPSSDVLQTVNDIPIGLLKIVREAQRLVTQQHDLQPQQQRKRSGSGGGAGNNSQPHPSSRDETPYVKQTRLVNSLQEFRTKLMEFRRRWRQELAKKQKQQQRQQEEEEETMYTKYTAAAEALIVPLQGTAGRCDVPPDYGFWSVSHVGHVPQATAFAASIATEHVV